MMPRAMVLHLAAAGLAMAGVWAGLRVTGPGPRLDTRARLCVAWVPGLDWDLLARAGSDGRTPRLQNILDQAPVTGTLGTPGQPPDEFANDLFNGRAASPGRPRPIWHRLAEQGADVVLVGWDTRTPRATPGRLLVIPPYPDLQRMATNSTATPLDRQLPGWRALVVYIRTATEDGMKTSAMDAWALSMAGDMTLLKVARLAMQTYPGAHVFLNLSGYSNLAARSDPSLAMRYGAVLDQGLLAFLQEVVAAGATAVLLADGGQSPPAAPGLFLAWGPLVQAPPTPLAVNPADMYMTLLYLAGTELPRDHEGGVILKMLEDGLFFRRPVVFEP